MNIKSIEAIEKESESPKDRKPFQMDDELEEQLDKWFDTEIGVKYSTLQRKDNCKQFITDNFTPNSECISKEELNKIIDKEKEKLYNSPKFYGEMEEVFSLLVKIQAKLNQLKG